MTVGMPEVAGVEHRFVEANGVRFHVAEAGAGAGDPIVLLHGWPQHWWMWRALIGPLAEHHRVLCPDLRGLGWSEAPAHGYAKADLASDVLAVLDALEVGRFKLIGHDWGAFVGFLMCLRAPQRIERYIACSIPHLWPENETPSLKALSRLWYQVVLAAPLMGEGLVRQGELIRQVLVKGRAVGSYSKEELDAYLDVIRQPARARASVGYYRTFLLHELRPLVAGHFRSERLRVPTRLVGGGRDPILRGSSLAGHEDYADDMAIEWVPDAGHFLPEEAPEAILGRARSFFG